jgi:AraC family transcriptional regulator
MEVDRYGMADASSGLAVEGLILELPAESSRCRSEAPLARRSQNTFACEFRQKLHARRTPRVCGVHPVHLSRVFREKVGCRIGEYLRRLRVEEARREISETERPLAEIAYGAGFADQSHLTNISEVARLHACRIP